jgi:hypothetical protein
MANLFKDVNESNLSDSTKAFITGNVFKDVTRINLSELNVLTNLIDGKVVVINSNNTYTMYKPFNSGDITNGFDPIDYDLCRADFYVMEYTYGLEWDQQAGKHVKRVIKSEKNPQYTTYRIGTASSDNKYAAKKKRELKLIQDMYQEQLSQQACEKTVDPSVYNLRAGDTIHLKSRQGIYRVVSVDYYTISITCNKWSVDGSEPIKIISKSDFKCYAGGLHNWSRRY